MTLSRHLDIVYFLSWVSFIVKCCIPVATIIFLLKQYFSRPYKLLINLQIYYHMQIIFVEWFLYSIWMEHCYFSANVWNNSIFSKSVELLINIFWRSNICTIANLTNRNKWFHTFIQNSLFYRLSHNAIQIWMLTGLCEELLLLDLL